MSKRIIGLVAVAFVLVGVLAVFGAPSASADDENILRFETMVGNRRPYVGPAGAIRGVNGAGRPWVIRSADGRLEADGKFKLEVEGVVFDPNDQSNIDAGLAGRNTVEQFGAIVSFQSVDASGAPNVVNLRVGAVPATLGAAKDGGGNAEFEAKLDLPKPCIAPIVFVTNTTFAGWFAATGN